MEGYSRKEKLLVQVKNTQEEREHFHQDIELLYVLEGSMDVAVGEKVTHMEPEDVLIVNANKKHSLRGTKDILFAKLSIDYHLVSDIFQSVDIIFWCDSTKEHHERYEELRRVIKQLLNHYLSTQGGVANFGHIALCYQIMDILSVHFLVQAADRENMDDTDRFEERILQINNYIRANYSQPISLKDLSEKLYLSNGYLSRFFKKNYGMSFAEYLTNIRLYHAVDELLYTGMPITRIAYDNGFASVAVFNKAFKKAYGETPSAVRKKSREPKEDMLRQEHDTIVEQRLEQFLRDDGLEREIPEIQEKTEEVVSVRAKKETACIWNRMINIGSAEELLRSEVREHVILLKEALDIQYVRFWNIFSKELLIDISREDEEYNFSKLDSILDFLLQQRIRPHIELGQKPKRIHGSVQNLLMITEEPEVGFTDLGHWEKVLKAVMRHLVHRYGSREVGTWRMELWMEESQKGNPAAEEGYLELFEKTYEVIHRYSTETEVGGCGLRLGYMQESNEEFLEKWAERKCRPDFLSIIYYAYVKGEIAQDNYSKRNTDDDALKNCILSTKAILRKAKMQDTRLYVTEWNLTISDRNYINDTCFKGAYIVKNMLDIYGMADEIGYFIGSDRASEYYDSHTMLYGGTGIITKDGILKPSGFAFEFLGRLYPYFIGKGDHYLITTDKNDTYGIICHNQKKLNYNYYFTKEDEIEKEQIWKYFEDREALELHLKLEDLEDGLYQVKTYRINEHAGSVLNIWAEMGYESELSRNDIKYFRRVCEPRLNIQKQQAKGGIMELTIKMEPNEITFVRVRRLV
ncbi:MAG: helix-turn-helix domain-containing protein [Faecalicatena sp.]|uniref:GH39 family glycosyl hydrolase n=1 Tax=Faecalicatena sp. TaxID=2005360 RepID=UPI00258ECCFE|nr:helix-turn-helix domain-containing protein [Faecalicatena sp.]MCI6466173.1 helix-turn-helix domain-containing protein [Faecalicatena sp.]MDY5619338.1 helix-turn-helix domain-containing protein [Lachnospiraceae bacterium]